MPIASPVMYTRACSSMRLGLVRKKKARVTWKRAREVMRVLAERSAMVAGWLVTGLQKGCIDWTPNSFLVIINRLARFTVFLLPLG